IAGHRTTYGAPFNRIDELEPGDEILVRTAQGAFRYEVEHQLVVRADEVGVLRDFGDDRLTLTSCHPEYSARQRIVVVASLAGDAAAARPPTGAGRTPPGDAARTGDVPADASRSAATSPGGSDADAGLGGEDASPWPAAALAAACAVVWVAAWLAGRRWRRAPAYLLGLPVFLVALFFFFESFSRLLPANF
ncbi:MAG TPA: class E sortase, partial [Acidimicrobiales bacterium]|nr:class E sortase [Acidimicrobiales bacterium]